MLFSLYYNIYVPIHMSYEETMSATQAQRPAAQAPANANNQVFSPQQYQAVTEQQIANIKRIADYTRLANEIVAKSALEQSKNAYELSGIEAAGLSSILAINLQTSADNAITDAQTVGIRSAMMLASKGMETATLIAQFREKILGMFIQLLESRTTNIWGRTKTLTQNFKF